MLTRIRTCFRTPDSGAHVNLFSAIDLGGTEFAANWDLTLPELRGKFRADDHPHRKTRPRIFNHGSGQAKGSDLLPLLPRKMKRCVASRLRDRWCGLLSAQVRTGCRGVLRASTPSSF